MDNPFTIILARFDEIEELLRENGKRPAADGQGELVDVRTAARLCGASSSNIYRASWRKAHGFPAPHAVGKRILFKRLEVNEWFEGRKLTI